MTNWTEATLIESFKLSEDVLCMRFQTANTKMHIPGQYYSIRLISPEGYIADRDYSAAGAPTKSGVIELGVKLIPNGAVSPYLWLMGKGDKIKIKGPLGEHFNFEPNNAQFVFIAGGTGVVPFMSYIRARDRSEVTLIASFKTLRDTLYFEELKNTKKLNLVITLTKESAKTWQGYKRRIDKQILSKIPEIGEKVFYVCGSAIFVEDISKILVDMRIDKNKIKKEIFG